MAEEKDQQIKDEEETVEAQSTEQSQQENTQQQEEQGQTEQPSEEQTEPSEKDRIAELQQTIEQLKSEQEELNNRLLRVQADYDNFRRRTKEEKTAAAKYKVQSIAEKLLPVLDNFERGLNMEAESDETKSLLQGMEIVYRQLKDVFEAENIKEIEAEGKPFDPELHQAVMQVENEDVEPNTVVEVMQKGYILNDRVIRPAMVKVTA